MRDNVFFWSTILFSILVILGISILILHTSTSLYQGFLRLCGVNATTCQHIVESVNPISIIGFSIFGWVVAIFGWQIARTQIFLYAKNKRTFPLPNVLRSLSLRLNLHEKIVVVSGTSLFCAGVFRRRIYIGRDLLRELSDKELEAALIHETYHLKNYDPLKILLVTTLSRSLFFLPAVKELSKAYLKEKEVSADQLAASKVGRRHLSRALYKAFRRGSDHASGLPDYTAGFVSTRSETSFSSWGWGITMLIIGIGWILVKNSLATGGHCS
jgi:Zn-dependent protease with chaperone function